MPLPGKARPAEDIKPHSFMRSVVRTDAAGRFVRVSEPAKEAAPRSSREIPPDVLGRLITETSHRYGVDPLLVQSLMHVESNANPAATSPKGAVGLMQLVPSTAHRFGVQDAFDPKQNIEGGVRYLKYLQALYPGDLTLSIAAYNSGENAVAKYQTVPPYLETLSYVQKVTSRYEHLQSMGSLTPSPGHANAPQPQQRHVAETLDSEGRLYLSNR